MRKTVKEIKELIKEALTIYVYITPKENKDCQFDFPEPLAVNVDTVNILFALKESDEEREYFVQIEKQENGFILYIG